MWHCCNKSEDFYENAHPQANDIFLIIEVADTTVKYDREVKIPLYAENNIIEVWLVDINEQCVEVYQNPANNEYLNIQKFTQGETFSIQAFPNVNIIVDEILGQ